MGYYVLVVVSLWLFDQELRSIFVATEESSHSMTVLETEVATCPGKRERENEPTLGRLMLSNSQRMPQ